MIAIEIDITGVWKRPARWRELAETAVRAAMEQTGMAIHTQLRLEVSVLLCDDAEIHALNREWRSKDRSTNVLSFPMHSRAELLDLPADGPPVMLGDIVLAHETCTREAAEKGVPFEHHAAHLIVHGLLHLAGYDHETSASDADAMELREIKALALMGIANPY